MNDLIAQTNPFGEISIPGGLGSYGNDPGIAFGRLIQFGLRAMVIGAAIYALFNLALAGYSFMSAGDDTKKVSGAWSQISQTLIGLSFSAGAFVLAALFGKLIFNDYGFLLNPVIPMP